MMMSLDGYIAGPDGDIALSVPEEELHRHFNKMMKQTSIELCGRRMYEVMRFWDSPERETSASEVERDFARAWQETPKQVLRLLSPHPPKLPSKLSWRLRLDQIDYTLGGVLLPHG